LGQLRRSHSLRRSHEVSSKSLFVILSAVWTSRSEAHTKSKDPYLCNLVSASPHTPIIASATSPTSPPLHRASPTSCRMQTAPASLHLGDHDKNSTPAPPPLQFLSLNTL